MSGKDGAVVVTGASGFIGRHLVAQEPRCVGVRVRSGEPVGERLAQALASSCAQPAALVHLAGAAHRGDVADPQAIDVYRRHNRDLAVATARAAISVGIRRFVYVSTIGVHGQSTAGTPFRPQDTPAPATPYAQSKYEGEQALTALAAQEGLELVVVRPPLVVGAGAPGNMARLARVLEAGLPLPLGAVRNRRALVGVRDLSDLLLRAARVPEAIGSTLLPAESPSLSTPELIRRLASALQRPARLWPLPVPALRAVGQLTGRARTVGQLVDDLEVDSTEAERTLGWRVSVGLTSEFEAFAQARRDAA